VADWPLSSQVEVVLVPFLIRGGPTQTQTLCNFFFGLAGKHLRLETVVDQ
jgi:hypothetical protein